MSILNTSQKLQVETKCVRFFQNEMNLLGFTTAGCKSCTCQSLLPAYNLHISKTVITET